MTLSRTSAASLLAVALGTGGEAATSSAAPAQEVGAAPGAGRVDYLTFARGAVPVRIGGPGAALGANFEHAVRIVDGDSTGFSFVSRANAQTLTEFVYVLPAATTFDRFAVPNVLETPSPAQTFTKHVEVHGSAIGPEDGYTLLASGTLATHRARGEVTELTLAAKLPVRWVKLRLTGGLDVQRDEMFLEFSEIVGNGAQQAAPLSERFGGTWLGRGVALQLKQQGAAVSGCYDRTGSLAGTVDGNLLRAVGADHFDKTESAFVLSVADDGTLLGVRSSNKGPFRLYTAPKADAGARVRCASPGAPALGCGSVIHGIHFDLDSAELRLESEPVLAQLHAGLAGDASASIVIEGHTSSEGAEVYNQGLSERRALAVVDDLVRRGLARARLGAVGAGEGRPIATNGDETGRSLNRRVEVRCR